MNNNLSLVKLMQQDPHFGSRFVKKVDEIKREKKELLNNAAQYEDRYYHEVVEGTKLRAKLLTEGVEQGKTEQEIMREHGKFVPTVYTPILNMLYFILRENEEENPEYYKNLYAQRDRINEELTRQGMLDHKDNDNLSADENISELLDELTRKAHEETATYNTRHQVNQRFEEGKLNRPKEENVEFKETPDMVQYLYGKVSLDEFNTLKKLKSLTNSNNIAEATLAFEKGKKLCARLGLEWDKIPCYYKK